MPELKHANHAGITFEEVGEELRGTTFGADNKPSLSLIEGTLTRLAPDPTTTSGNTNNNTSAPGVYWRFTPDADFWLAGIWMPSHGWDNFSPEVRLNVFRVSDQTLVANGDSVAQGGGDQQLLLQVPYLLEAGIEYQIGIATQDGTNQTFHPRTDEATWTGFTTPAGYSFSSGTNGYPSSGPFSSIWAPFSLEESAGAIAKGTQGPVDPDDHRAPLGTTAARPTGLGTDESAMYFDTDLGKPIFWTGSGWVDATGTAV